MPSSNICWGIEIGAHAIKALKLELAGETLRVVDFALVPHKKVLSTPGIDQSDVLRVSLGELVSQFEFAGANIAMSVPGHSAFARFAKLPPVEPKKIPDIVKFEAVQQIPFPIDQVEWDYQTFMSPDSPDVEVGIFAITREPLVVYTSNVFAILGLRNVFSVDRYPRCPGSTRLGQGHFPTSISVGVIVGILALLSVCRSSFALPARRKTC